MARAASTLAELPSTHARPSQDGRPDRAGASAAPQRRQSDSDRWCDAEVGSSEDYESEDEAALGLETAPPEFYDPAADDRDEKWAAKQRQGRKSDAILSCPGCLTTVCIDCQQHAVFENQFRAMFIMNCRVDTATVRSGPQEQRGKKRGRRRQELASAVSAADEQPGQRYHPVLCDLCDTEMGVQSTEDEVFTFLNVVPSAA